MTHLTVPTAPTSLQLRHLMAKVTILVSIAVTGLAVREGWPLDTRKDFPE